MFKFSNSFARLLSYHHFHFPQKQAKNQNNEKTSPICVHIEFEENCWDCDRFVNIQQKDSSAQIDIMNVARQYACLATINQYKIELMQQGLNVLDQFDFCSLLTIIGDLNGEGQVGNQMGGNCVVVEKDPMYSTRLKRYVVVMRIIANDLMVLNIAHTFCALLSHVVVVSNYDTQDLQFLSAPVQIIADKQSFSSKISALMGVTQDSQSGDIIQNNQKFARTLEQQGTQMEMFNKIYNDWSAYQVPPNKNIWAVQNILENIIESRVSSSNLLIHGQVICEYAINLAEQFNSSSKMNPSRAEDDIQVDQQFDSYLAVVDRYNSKCKNTLGNEVQTDLPARLQSIRYETEQEPVLKNNPHYSKKMGRYMDRKQQELSTLNQQFNDAYNLNLLQKQSARSLEQVRNNPNVTQQDVTAEIDRLTNRYNDKSRGINKHKLLSEFLQVFVPSVYAEADISRQMDKKINTLSKQNKSLEDQLAKLQKKNSKCCMIM